MRKAQHAVAIVFFINGAMLGSWAPHVAVVQARLEAGPAALGVALLWMAAGGLFAMPIAGRLTSRFGSAPVTSAGALACALALPVAALAGSLEHLIFGLILFGAANGTVDVAMNAHAIALERRFGRAVMSSMHGMWSAGGLFGSVLAGIAFSIVSPQVHILVVSGLFGLVLLYALGNLLPGEIDRGSQTTQFRLPRAHTLVLGGFAFIVMMSEGAMLDWSAVYLAHEIGTGATVAAMGYAVFSGAMMVGRFTGDLLRQHFGRVSLVRASGLLAGGGLLVSSLAGHPAAVLFGFLLLGFGLANLVPLIFLAAAEGGSAGPGEGIAAVATVGYTGFLAGPPIIGMVGEVADLGVGLGILALGCLVVGVAAGQFRA